MAIATMTSKGQITMPMSVRESLGLRPGAKVDFVPFEDGFKVIAVKSDLKKLKGRFAGRVLETVSLEAMDAAIAESAVARHRGGSKPKKG